MTRWKTPLKPESGVEGRNSQCSSLCTLGQSWSTCPRAWEMLLRPLENFSESPACLHCITSWSMSGGYCPDSSPCCKNHLAFCTVLTNVHHVYRVLVSPLTLGYFLRNLHLDAMNCSVKIIHKAVFRYGKLVQQGHQFNFQQCLSSNFKTVQTV